MNGFKSISVVVPLLAALVAGCASTGYLADRRRDAADIVTLTLGAGDGVKARVGPLQVAVIRNADLVGLRAGAWFANGDGLLLNDETYSLFPLFSVWNRTRRMAHRERLRRALATGRPITTPAAEARAAKAGAAEKLAAEAHPLERRWITRRSKWTRLFGEESFSHGLHSESERRGKNVLAKAPTPCTIVGAGAPFYSQIEVAGGLLFSARVGFNPGELLDFLLGWVGIDLYGDDLADRSAWR